MVIIYFLFIKSICSSSLPFSSEIILLYVVVDKRHFSFGFGQRNNTLLNVIPFIQYEALVLIIFGAARTEIAQGLALSKVLPILPLTTGRHTAFTETVLTFFLRSVFSASITCTSVHSPLIRLMYQLSLIYISLIKMQ